MLLALIPQILGAAEEYVTFGMRVLQYRMMNLRLYISFSGPLYARSKQLSAEY